MAAAYLSYSAGQHECANVHEAPKVGCLGMFCPSDFVHSLQDPHPVSWSSDDQNAWHIEDNQDANMAAFDRISRRQSLINWCESAVGCLIRHSPADALTPLVVVTLNLQYYSSYPSNRADASRKLREVAGLGGPRPADIICVQEGLACENVLEEIGYELIVCAGSHGTAQAVREMVYDDAPALRCCNEDSHGKLLCNQIYIRSNSQWLVADRGIERISSHLRLAGGGGRAEGNLAVRSMAWVKVQRIDSKLPAAVIMCTHVSGGRFEDQYFVQQLAQERRLQAQRCLDFFEHHRPAARQDDIGILVGDFNATTEYSLDGPMHGYFKACIANSSGVKVDAAAAGLDDENDLMARFKEYMMSPFEALREAGWTFAYGKEVGFSSSFGHLIDHMATNKPVPVDAVDLVFLTNQKGGGRSDDTDLVITDHNAIRTTFKL